MTRLIELCPRAWRGPYEIEFRALVMTPAAASRGISV